MGADSDVTKQPGTSREARVRARVRQYELIREIGRGGMGTVYLARDTKLARRVAIKFLADASAEIAARFLVEARATARCNHENIVVIHEVDELEGQPYMVLEYLEGKTLRQLLDGTPMPAARAVELVVPVVRALACAHGLAIVHRDLKPENIFITEAGGVKVLDFGIAKLHGEPEAAPGRHGEHEGTHDSALVGTLPYMAPEQWGADEIDRRTDLWATGVVLFELLAGRHPLAPATHDRLMAAALRLDDPLPALSTIVPAIDPDLERVVAKCLAKRKTDRYADAGELLAALEPHLPRRRSPAAAELDPYPGLAAFREEDADLFHGRRGEIARLVGALGDRPLAAVVGASGAGKSSLVRAGLIPELKRRERWDVAVTRPGRHPLESLAAAALELTSTADRRADDPQLATRLAAEPGLLGELLRRRARSRGARVIVFVDQFEELYTLVDDMNVRRAYLACLQGAADDPLSPVRVVVSLRSDFLDRVADDTAFIDALTPGIVFVAAADREDLRAALVEPAQYAGYHFESDALVDDMVAELAKTAGALPLLQFAASQLWDERDRKARTLTRASYESMGGVAGALASHADAVIAGLAPAAQELARRIVQRLVTPERTRDVVELADLLELAADPKQPRTLVDHLVAARLLAIRSGTGAATVELVHESLIDRWPTLARWLDQSQGDAAFLARLRGAAKQWDDGKRSAGLLWRGEAADDARRWSRAYRGELARREQAYLDAVFRLAERATRTRRIAFAGTMTLLALLAVAAIVALIWIRNAETRAVAEAQHARDEAEHARAATEEVKAKNAQQVQLTAEREAARSDATKATGQVEADRNELERINKDLRAALAQKEIESKHALAEAAAAVEAKRLAEKATVVAEEQTRAAEQQKRIADEQRARAEASEKQERDRLAAQPKIAKGLR